MKAYVLSDRGEANEHCLVVFAKTARDARHTRALDDVAYIDIAAKRAPQFDSFAPGPVPMVALLADGWWFECGGCFDVLREDHDGLIVDENAREAFCDEECQSRAIGRDLGHLFMQREHAAFEADVARRFPDSDWRTSAYWNRSGFRELPPVEGFRLYARVSIAGRYGTIYEGDRDVTWDAARVEGA